MAPEPTLVSVLRHGQVEGRPHVYRGTLDEPMSEAGLEQVRRLADRLASPPFDGIASSPLTRCRAFASLYAGERNLTLTLLDAMREMNFGSWEGLTPVEAARLDPECHAGFCAHPGQGGPPHGESLADLRARVGRGWHAWLADAGGGHRLLVTHAGVMRALFMELFGLDPDCAYRVALPQAAHFQVSVLPGAAPVLLNLNACAI